jgi:hypothetical protein
MDDAQGFADLRLAEEDEPQLALVSYDDALVSQFVSKVLHFEGWSVLEAAGAIAAVAMANSEPLELEEDLPVLMVVGHPETARRTGSRARSAVIRQPFAVGEMVAGMRSKEH